MTVPDRLTDAEKVKRIVKILSRPKLQLPIDLKIDLAYEILEAIKDNDE